MDEILIEDKKYVSSKQAAKITGYAKDYIGQLCREGRVPARLVGRSWYVLESAIQDHRFGNPGDGAPGSTETVPKEGPHTDSVPVMRAFSSDPVGTPRYESAEVDLLPPLNRLRTLKTTTAATDAHRDEPDADEILPAAATDLHESWKAWFDTNEIPSEEESVSFTKVSEPEHSSYPEEEAEESAEEPVPLRVRTSEAIYHDALPTQVTRIAPRQTQAPKIEEEMYHPADADRQVLGQPYRIMTTVSVVVAVAAAFLALVGTGYFDSYFYSHGQAAYLTGISVYKK